MGWLIGIASALVGALIGHWIEPRRFGCMALVLVPLTVFIYFAITLEQMDEMNSTDPLVVFIWPVLAAAAAWGGFVAVRRPGK